MLSPDELSKFDAPLIALANLSGGDLRKLFYAFFMFLHTRTDFYCITGGTDDDHINDGRVGGGGGMNDDDNDGGGGGGGARTMGFREGQAERILLASFRQFPLRRVPSKKSRPDNSTKATTTSTKMGGTKSVGAVVVPTAVAAAAAAGDETSPAAANVDARSEDDDASTAERTDAAVALLPPSSSSTGRYTDEGKRVHIGSEDEDTSTTDETSTTVASNADTDAAVALRPPSMSSSFSKAAGSTSPVRYTDEGKQVPVGNGGSTSRYVWTQTLEEVTVHVPLPDGVRARDLDVNIGATTILIRRKRIDDDDDDDDVPSLGGTLFAKVRPSESTWTLESNDVDRRNCHPPSSSSSSSSSHRRPIATLQIVLEKVQKTWWETVISGDTPLIDTTMVDSTRHIGTYDDETQAEIRRIMFDQRQERMGLPTSSHLLGTSTMTTTSTSTSTSGGGEDRSPSLPPGGVKLPSGVEYIDGETLDRASVGGNK
jgi:hypothetical protein